MPGKRMTRAGEAEALRRIEQSARTTGEFRELTEMYDKLDENRKRKEREWEKADVAILYNLKDELKYNDGGVVPTPIIRPYWQELMRGDFISTIYDNPNEIWQIIGDWQVGRIIKNLTLKQRDVLFRSSVRLCSAEQIAECTDKTSRGVNKLLAATLKHIRKFLAEQIQIRIDKELFVTLEKQRFFEWYTGKKRNA